MKGWTIPLSKVKEQYARVEQGKQFFLLVKALELQLLLHLKASTYLLILIREQDGGGGGKGNGGLCAARSSQLGRVNGRNTDWLMIYTATIRSE